MPGDIFTPSSSHVDLLDHGLKSVYGGSRIFAKVTPETTHLILNHNPLGDWGAVRFFHILGGERKDVRLKELHLNSCELGDMAMKKVAKWLKTDETLEALYLNGNQFTGDTDAALELAEAVNASRLRLLSLSSNALGDSFLSVFLCTLSSPYLQKLLLSMIGLTVASVDVIRTYLSSPASRPLRQMTLNANSLSAQGIRTIIETLQACNYTIGHLEVDANWIEGDDQTSIMKQRTLLLNVLTRNRIMKDQVSVAALSTLRYGRSLLHAYTPPNSTSLPPLLTLPTELRLDILRALSDPASTLSGAQFGRIVDYCLVWTGIDLPSEAEGKTAWLARVGCEAFDGTGGRCPPAHPTPRVS